MREIFILVPSLHPTGPIKGAIALANAFAKTRRVTLVCVRQGPGAQSPLSSDVAVLSLGGSAKVGRLVDVLEAADGRRGAAVVSYCLSADFAALRVRGHARWISSVRGNLVRNYRFDYGVAGPLIASVHLTALRLADRVVAMTDAMADQVSRFTGTRPAVIGNFIDEPPLEAWRRPASTSAPIRFAFLGSLTRRKQPLLVIRSLKALIEKRVKAELDIVGGGPLAPEIEKEIAALGLAGIVTLHGELHPPYGVVAAADALVLPSLSEGMSRAALEALHLGVPTVLRKVDGNRELIIEGQNGALFTSDDELPAAMLAAANVRRDRSEVDSLLPTKFRQGPCAEQVLALIDLEEAGK